MQVSDLSLLASWQNYYMIVGTAAATLMGLMFVAMGLVVGVEHNLSTLDAGISAFNTPTVVHFGAVFLAAALLGAPWQSLSAVRLALAALGLAAILYMVLVIRRMRTVPAHPTPFKDWMWYVVFPLIPYVVLLGAAIALPTHPAAALYIVAAALLTLLFLGVHNAWDLVTYFALTRARAESKRKAR